MTLEALAAKLEMHHSHLSRIEKGERPLSIKQAEAIASALSDTAPNVMGFDAEHGSYDPSAPGGFQEDFAPFEDEESPGWRLPPLVGHEYRYKVTSDVLARIGILPGDVVYVDQDAKLCANPKPLQPVRVHWFEPDGDGTPHWLLRQFVPPHLLITNAEGGRNAPAIDMQAEDAKIVGVITGIYRRTHFG